MHQLQSNISPMCHTKTCALNITRHPFDVYSYTLATPGMNVGRWVVCVVTDCMATTLFLTPS